GEQLVVSGLVDKATLGRALEAQKTKKNRLGEILMEMGLFSDVELAKALAEQYGLPFIRLAARYESSHATDLVPLKMAKSYELVPLGMEGGDLLIALSDPSRLYEIEKDVQFVAQTPTRYSVAPRFEVLDVIGRVYTESFGLGTAELEETLDSELIVSEKTQEEYDGIEEIIRQAGTPPVIRVTNSILADAILSGASDIHLEPQKESLLIRTRVDGIMRSGLKLKLHLHTPIVSRIKIISKLDISIRRAPQDGKTQIRFRGKEYDLRVSTLPTNYGEKVTIRILDPSRANISPQELGLRPRDLKAVMTALESPEGIILVTGPTGSGKSSTLYAFLNKLNKPEVNIVTVEDPIEFEIKGVNQVQTNPRAGTTFATALRSILRQDPDIILLGEIRDNETALIAMRAAQTGHLVLSSLHTNDAPSAAIRLIDLGVEPFLIASSLIASVGQRLARKICDQCKVQSNLTDSLKKQLQPFIDDLNGISVFKGAGCEACNHTGYKGRMGLFEVLTMDNELRRIIGRNVTAEEIAETARKSTYSRLVLDGIRKATEGVTTFEEVFRVASLQLDSSPEPATVLMPGPSEHADAATPLQGEHFEPPAFEEEALGGAEKARPKILVIDDNDDVIALLQRALESENYEVITAQDGLQGLKLALRQRPDLIITDYLMPGMDGLELLKNLKARPETNRVPVIMLTARDEVDSEVNVLDSGAHDYIVKPVNRKKFLARVKKVLRTA
ncbi:ATPase, T2SS/T4P/T4SS family, partial [Thermodesulfobacteriota bacterium]